MIKNFIELYNQFSVENKWYLFRLQLLVIVSSVLEVLSILSIAPFMYLMIEPEFILNNKYYYSFFAFLNILDQNEMLVIVGCMTITIFSLSTFFSIYTQNKFIYFSFVAGADIGNTLFKYYLNKDWIFFTSNNSNNYLRKISQEAERVSTGVIGQALMMNSRIVLSGVIIFSVFLYNSFVALFLFSMFGISYLIIFKFLKKRILYHGENISIKQNARFKIMSESFGGIRDIILNNLNTYFIRDFKEASLQYARSQGSNVVFSLLPRYLVELVSYGSIIVLCIVLLLIQQNNTTSILATLSVFGLASLRLLPAFQSIYFNYSNISGNINAYYSIRNELFDYLKTNELNKNKNYIKLPKEFKEIKLIDIDFKYPNSKKNILKNINLSIGEKERIGIVGMTGSGKSTLVDIISGLILPTNGQVKIDNYILNDETKNSWYDYIGLVNQNIFISDQTIIENIAYGIPKNQIDLKKIKNIVNTSLLDEFVYKLPNKYNTVVGERGIQLSGGQKQRIAIARALYFNKKILILDEATSSIDAYIEDKIISRILEISKNMTLIMISHRINTLKECDTIYTISGGKIVDKGKFEYLIKNSEEFKKIAKINNNIKK